MLTWLTFIAGAYLIGSIPFGFIIGRMRGVDIREHGSRNVGATNVGRVLGKRLGFLCFFLDLFKGAAPVAAAGIAVGVFGDDLEAIATADLWAWLSVAAAAVAGHMFSIFLGFGGGKGVATGFGAMLGMWPLLTFPALFAFATWFVTLRLLKYVSLASVVAAASLPVWVLLGCVPDAALDAPLEETLARLRHGVPLLIVTALLALVTAWKHRGNLARIRRGEEPRVKGWRRRGGMPTNEGE